MADPEQGKSDSHFVHGCSTTELSGRQEYDPPPQQRPAKTQTASIKHYHCLDMYQRECEQLLSELREGTWTKQVYKEMIEELKVRFGLQRSIPDVTLLIGTRIFLAPIQSDLTFFN